MFWPTSFSQETSYFGRILYLTTGNGVRPPVPMKYSPFKPHQKQNWKEACTQNCRALLGLWICCYSLMRFRGLGCTTSLFLRVYVCWIHNATDESRMWSSVFYFPMTLGHTCSQLQHCNSVEVNRVTVDFQKLERTKSEIGEAVIKTSATEQSGSFGRPGWSKQSMLTRPNKEQRIYVPLIGWWEKSIF